MHLSAIPTLFALIPSFGTAVSALPLTKSNHEPHNPPVRELYIWQQREQSTYPKTRRYIIQHCPSPDAVVAVGNVPFNTSNLLPLDKRDAKNVSPNVCGTGPPGGCRMYFKRDDPYWQEDHWDILNSWKSPWDNTKRFAPLAASLEPVPKPPSTEDRAFCNGMAHAFKAAGYTSSGTARLDDAASALYPALSLSPSPPLC
ncbi:hypothetical protein K432DRAFT_391566 [Lepidopterella palustris CBS 459.81]|uniref:Ecp2 effector protein domain-containing protein n=1 Tax=Lepidopterella palustris CBS 459.81 TaxID=1314670 RepID=A0A8E2EEF9_9PEZI|nr:hypothetical protein K432DRAFT_391566 [Lepidopterella palustris CBS 459.81]